MDETIDVEDELKIVLIGKTETGKSSTGNSILGNDAFKSKSGGSAVTRNCKKWSAVKFGRRILVIDTPGLFDTGLTKEDVTKEIVKCIGMSAPGPHAVFFFVTGIGKFNVEEQETFYNNFWAGTETSHDCIVYSIALYLIIVLNIFLDSQNRIPQGNFRGTWTLK